MTNGALTVGYLKSTMQQASRDVTECDNYECDVCHRNFVTEIQLSTHLWQAHISNVSGSGTPGRIAGRKTYRCPFCGYHSRYKQNVVVHIRRHTGEKPFKCSVCHYASPDLSTLYSHMWTKHPDAKPFKCDVCNENFVTPRQLRYHLQRRHIDQSLSLDKADAGGGPAVTHFTKPQRHFQQRSGVWLYACDICDFASRYRCSIYRHVRIKHPGTQISPGPTSSTITPGVADWGPVRAGGGDSRDEHHPVQQKNTEQELPGSGDCFRLSQPSVDVSPDAASQLIPHAGGQPADKPHMSAVCGYGSEDSDDSSTDSRHTHRTGEKLYKCKLCSHVTDRMSALYRHINSQHRGICNPLKCTVCDQEFDRPGKLIQHLQCHI